MDKIKYIKENKFLNIDGINYGRVMACELYDTSIKAYCKHLCKCLLFDFKLVQSNSPNFDLLFFYSLKHAKRLDYDEIKDNFLKIFNECSCLDSVRYFSLIGVFKKIILILKYYISFRNKIKVTPLLCAILVTEYKELYLKFKDIDVNNFKLIVSFCDSHPEDNLFTQFIKNKGVITCTLQHGQYRILNENKLNADAEAYKNFISDCLLAWGKATQDEFSLYGINPKRVVPVGALKRFSFINRQIQHIMTGVFGVVLSGDTYTKSNIDMIIAANKIAEIYNMKYFVRFHPRNNIDLYLKYINKSYLKEFSNNVSNEQYVAKVDFSIIHMTGVFVELLGLNSILFVYKDEFLEKIFEIKNFVFKNIDDFNRAYLYYIKNKSESYDYQYKIYKYFNNSNNIEENYKEVIMKYLNA